jgi:hypothetical protein
VCILTVDQPCIEVFEDGIALIPMDWRLFHELADSICAITIAAKGYHFNVIVKRLRLSVTMASVNNMETDSERPPEPQLGP